MKATSTTFVVEEKTQAAVKAVLDLMDAFPKWRKGPPDGPGYWLVEESQGDVEAWLVFWDQDDADDGKATDAYLRFDSPSTSEPLAQYHQQWPVVRCFGPIPWPRGKKKPAHLKRGGVT